MNLKGKLQKPISKKAHKIQRIHQGIAKITDAEIQERSDPMQKMKVLSGLRYHYYHQMLKEIKNNGHVQAAT